MPLFTIPQIDAVAQSAYGSRRATKSAGAIFAEDRPPIDTNFDIFLSHSYTDAMLDLDRLLGIKAILEEFEYSVYVDWIIDSFLSRTDVSAETASVLRNRMDHSKCL